MTKRHRFIRFSLRTFLVSVTVSCIFLGIWTNRANRQKRAVGALADAGGSFAYSYQSMADPQYPSGVLSDYDPNAKPLTPEWLRSLMGDDFFVTPESLSITIPPPDRAVDTKALEQLQNLPHLERLTLYNVKLDDAGASHLQHLRRMRFLVISRSDSTVPNELDDFSFLECMPHLQGLVLTRSNFDDDDATSLAGLPRLEILFFHGSPKLSDAGMASIGQIVSLDKLVLEGTKVGDRGIAQLSRLKKLRVLGLKGSPVGDEAMAAVGQLANLEELDLTGTNVGDDGVAQLSNLKKLKAMRLNETQVSDASLDRLSQMPGLVEIELRRTKVSNEGLRRLRAALPKCKVSD